MAIETEQEQIRKDYRRMGVCEELAAFEAWFETVEFTPQKAITRDDARVIWRAAWKAKSDR